MKRTSVPGEWTDGKHEYVGNPRDGFTLKTEPQPEPEPQPELEEESE